MMTAKKFPMPHDIKLMFILDTEQNKHGIDFRGVSTLKGRTLTLKLLHPE